MSANPAHEAYFFCDDNSDPEVICVFQLYNDLASVHDFLDHQVGTMGWVKSIPFEEMKRNALMLAAGGSHRRSSSPASSGPAREKSAA